MLPPPREGVKRVGDGAPWESLNPRVAVSMIHEAAVDDAGGPIVRLGNGDSRGGLLVAAGHAIYEAGQWHGGWLGEERFYEEHVRAAFELLDAEGYRAVAFSGGHTRPDLDVTHSEGEGMVAFARDAGLDADREGVLVESLARDSFENVFFSMLRFHCQYREWPSRVGVVSWPFKALRFYLIACGLRLADGRFRFHGRGMLDSQEKMETVAVANARYDACIVQGGHRPVLYDPLHRDPAVFAAKRRGRMPRELGGDEAAYLARVKAAYDVDFDAEAGRQGVVGELLDRLAGLEPGPAWREVAWPWVRSAAGEG